MRIKEKFKDPMSEERRSFFEKRPWHFYSWEFIIVIVIIFIIALLNQIPHWVKDSLRITFADGSGGQDYYEYNGLRDNIIYSYIVLGITIAGTIFIGVYNVLGNYIGKYSSALFVLVPSIVWLLTTTKNNHISNIIEVNNMIYEFCFWLTVGLTGFYFLILIAKRIVIMYIYGFETRRFLELIVNGLYRINLVFINIASLFILSSVLVNFGLFTLHLADIPLELQKAAVEPPHETIIGQYNINSEKLKTYIAIVTLFFALLMVSIGLTITLAKAKNKDFKSPLDEMQMEIESDKTREMHIKFDRQFIEKERRKDERKGKHG